jgi:hypothetical protein
MEFLVKFVCFFGEFDMFSVKFDVFFVNDGVFVYFNGVFMVTMIIYFFQKPHLSSNSTINRIKNHISQL